MPTDTPCKNILYDSDAAAKPNYRGMMGGENCGFVIPPCHQDRCVFGYNLIIKLWQMYEQGIVTAKE